MELCAPEVCDPAGAKSPQKPIIIKTFIMVINFIVIVRFPATAFIRTVDSLQPIPFHPF